MKFSDTFTIFPYPLIGTMNVLVTPYICSTHLQGKSVLFIHIYIYMVFDERKIKELKPSVHMSIVITIWGEL